MTAKTLNFDYAVESYETLHLVIEDDSGELVSEDKSISGGYNYTERTIGDTNELVIDHIDNAVSFSDKDEAIKFADKLSKKLKTIFTVLTIKRKTFSYYELT